MITPLSSIHFKLYNVFITNKQRSEEYKSNLLLILFVQFVAAYRMGAHENNTWTRIVTSSKLFKSSASPNISKILSSFCIPSEPLFWLKPKKGLFGLPGKPDKGLLGLLEKRRDGLFGLPELAYREKKGHHNVTFRPSKVYVNWRCI